MQFEENTRFLRTGEMFGFTLAFVLFGSILFFVLLHTRILPSGFPYWPFPLGAIVISGLKFRLKK